MTVGQLAGVARAALGPGRSPVAVERLRGGSKKGVYRLLLDDGGTAVVYLWAASENYWPAVATATEDDHADPFSHASGLGLFLAAHRRLSALGVRTPRLLLADRTHAHHPADLAVVEDVPGESLEAFLERDPGSAAPVLARLAGTLRLMRQQTAPAFGKTALIDNGGVSLGSSCEQLVLDRALADLAEAADRDPRLAAVRDRVEAELHARAAEVRPRSEYALVHGELGPDHVLVDRQGQPVLIDIEGLMFFDPEWEHVFLRLRFAEHYHHLRAEGLDPRRLAFYDLAMSLSLVAGPLRLLDGDFPDRAFMLAVVEHNLARVLAALPPDQPANA
ncbi:phosphotransferase family protein [Kitasatospora sp. NPDC051853]|uniref:phosphotransferase family protein n=1 Tax=Kitasatospora sp. NPDC051853 TaxID=3364058 RepID=UPI00378C3752